MSPSLVRKIRYTVSALVLITLGVIAWSYRDRAGSRANHAPGVELLKPDVLKSTQKIEYSEIQGNKVVFKISADKYVQTAEKKNLLEGIRALNFGQDGSRRDSIESLRCQYDPDAQSVSFQGRVIIRTNEGAEILTESLSYAKSTEIAESSDRFSFRRGGFAGVGRGFAYYFREGLIRIRQEADFQIKTEPENGNKPPARPITIRSQQAIFYRDYRFYFTGAAEIKHGETRLAAEQIQVQLDEQGNILRLLTGRHSARLDLSAGAEVRQIGGNSVQLAFSQDGNTLQSVTAEEQAYFKTQETGGPLLNLTSARIELAVDPAGSPKTLRASDDAVLSRSSGNNLMWVQGGGLLVRFFAGRTNAQLLQFEKASRMRLLRGEELMELWAARFTARFQNQPGTAAFEDVRAENASVWQTLRVAAPAGQASDLQNLTTSYNHFFRSRHLDIEFDPSGRHPKELRGLGECRLESRITHNRQFGTRITTAENMSVHFASGTSAAQSLQAGPAVQLVEEIGPLRRITRSDALGADFDSRTGEIARIVQRGAFRFEQDDVRATSDEASYQVREQRLRLEGTPHIWDSQSDTKASVVEILEEGNEIRGQGNVRSIFRNTRGGLLGNTAGDSTPKNRGSQNIFLVTSNSMAVQRAKKTARYVGGVKASQGFDYVKADDILLDQNSQILQAHGHVETHFAALPGKSQEHSTPFHASSAQMIFRRNNRNMEFLENVQVISGDLKLNGTRMVVDFDDELQAVRKMSIFGGVQLAKGIWRGKGDEGEYRAAENTVVLTGNMAEIWDSQKRRTAGRRLTIHMPDDRVVIES